MISVTSLIFRLYCFCSFDKTHYFNHPVCHPLFVSSFLLFPSNFRSNLGRRSLISSLTTLFIPSAFFLFDDDISFTHRARLTSPIWNMFLCYRLSQSSVFCYLIYAVEKWKISLLIISSRSVIAYLGTKTIAIYSTSLSTYLFVWFSWSCHLEGGRTLGVGSAATWGPTRSCFRSGYVWPMNSLAYLSDRFPLNFVFSSG